MNTQIVGIASDFIETIPLESRYLIEASISALASGETKRLKLKTLKGKIKEIITGQYRIVFFSFRTTLFIVDVFKKQSQKTPVRIIKRAEKIYQKIAQEYA